MAQSPPVRPRERIIKTKPDVSVVHSVVFNLNLVTSPHLKNEDTSLARWLIAAIPAFGKLRQEDYHSFEVNLG